MRLLMVAVAVSLVSLASAQENNSRPPIEIIGKLYPIQYKLAGDVSKTIPRPVKIEAHDGLTFTNSDMVPVDSTYRPELNLYGSLQFTFPKCSVTFGLETHYEDRVDAWGTTRVWIEISNDNTQPIPVDFGQFQIIKDRSSLNLKLDGGRPITVIPGLSKIRQYYALLDIRDQISSIPGPREIRDDDSRTLVDSRIGPKNGFRIFLPTKLTGTTPEYFDAEIFPESYRVVEK